jgi:ABC-type sugar transport system ATPase subunit
MNTPIVELKNVSVKFKMSGGNYYVGLESINLSVDSGKVVAILGPSGAGKSTLLRVITGLLKPSSGEVYYTNSILNSESFSLKNAKY